MNQGQIISFVRERLQDINAGADPVKILKSSAADAGLSPAQLERAGQVYNTMLVLNQQRKGGTARGEAVVLLDVPAMVSEYEKELADPGPASKWASNISDRMPVFDRQEEKGGELAGDKSYTPPPRPVNAVLREAEKLADEAFALRDEAASKAKSFAKALKAAGVELNEIREDAWRCGGDGALEIVDSFMAGSFKTASTNDFFKRQNRLARDRYNVMPVIKEVFEKLTMSKAALAMADMVKESAGSTGVAPNKTNKGSGKSSGGTPNSGGNLGQAINNIKERPVTTVLETVSESVPFIFNTGSNVVRNIVFRSPQEFSNAMQRAVQDSLWNQGALFGSTPINKLDNEADEEIARDNFLMKLNYLKLTDPVINKHPPEVVDEIAEGIWQTARPAANNLSSLRFTLREGLQYVAVPTSTFKEWSEMSKNIAQAGKDMSMQKRRTYEIYKIKDRDKDKDKT